MLMVADALANLAMLSFPTIRSWIQLCWTPAAPSQDHGELVGPDIPDSDSGLAQGGYTPQSHAGAIPGAVPVPDYTRLSHASPSANAAAADDR